MTNYFSLIFNTSSVSDYIQIIVSIADIIISAGVAVWIVHTLQKTIDNERSTKDYCISEISKIQTEFRDLMSSAIAGQENTKLFKIKFNKLTVKVNALMKLLNKKYSIPINILCPYQTELLMKIEDDGGFNSIFMNQTENFQLTQETINNIYILDSNNCHIFYDIIESINKV